MPDDPNLFDDNDLLPDWLFEDGTSGGGGESSGGDADWLGNRLGSVPPAQTPPPVSGGARSPQARPAWETLPGRTPPATQRPAAVPPWQQYAASSAPGRAAPAVRPPWQTRPGPAPQPPAGGQAFVPAAVPPVSPAAPVTPPQAQSTPAASDDFDWAALSSDAQAAPSSGVGELPSGLTGMLPWRQTDQDSADAGLPASDQDDAWLGDFEPAASDAPAADTFAAGAFVAGTFDADTSATGPGLPVDEDDLDWLTGGAASEPLPDTSAEQDGEWPEDVFADLPTELAEPPAEVPPADSALPMGLIRRLDRLTPSEPPPLPAAPEPAPTLSVDDLFPFDEDELFPAEELAESDAGGTLFDEPEAAYEPPAVEPVPAARGDLPDWLLQAATPSSGAWEQAAPAEPSPAEAGELGGELPGWLDEEADFTTESAASELSYDEWEQAEQERAHQASKSAEDRLMEQVPDWFASEQPPAPAESETASQGTGPGFVPDWFTGLEEQNLEAAPDWFQQMDYTADPLAAPPEPPQPAQPDASAAAVPDWFKADDLLDSMAPDVDWAATFGAPPPAEQAPTGQVPAEQAISEWGMDELPLPDAADFLAGLDGGEAPGLGRDDDAWMRAFEPQEAPAYTPGSVQRGGLPADDFVERFDPLEPDQAASVPVGFNLNAPDMDGGMDWLQDLSAEDLVETHPAPLPVAQPPRPQEPELAVPEMPEPEAVEDEFLVEAMDSSQAIDSLLAMGESGREPTMPEVEEPLPQAVDIQSLEWTGDDPWLDLEPTRATALDLDIAAITSPGEQATPFSEAALQPESGLSAAPREVMRPEWLEEMRPADLPVTLVAGGAQLDMPQKSLDDLPDSVRALRDRLEATQVSESEAELAASPSDSGPLAGIAGALPIIAEALPTAQRETVVEGLVITPDEQKRIEKLQMLLDLLAAEEEEVDENAGGSKFTSSAPSPFDLGGEEEVDGEAEAEIESRLRPRRRHHIRFDRLLIMLIMLGALIVPFITDAVHFAADPPALADDQQAVANAVEALEPDDIVLVALEYGPTAAGELDALTEAVLRDITAQRAIPVMISTNPVMALHAEAVIAPLVEDALLLKARGNGETALTAGEDYALLAYLPGDELGVRSLAQAADENTTIHPAFDIDLRGEETHLPVRDVAADVALIVVAGEDSTAIRTWAEQLESLPVPKVVLATAAVEALAEPYVKANSYAGYLAGVRDTYSYNTARNSTTRQPYTVPEGVTFDVPDTAVSRWNSMALGAAAAAGLIALGMGVNMVRALGRRRRR